MDSGGLLETHKTHSHQAKRTAMMILNAVQRRAKWSASDLHAAEKAIGCPTNSR